MKNYKILFCDLDGTIIDTISGKTFPIGIWDMKFNFDVLDSIKNISPNYIFIVSNQGGVESGFVSLNDIESKLEYVKNSIKEYTGCETGYRICSTNDKNNKNRKPNVGMLDSCLSYVFSDSNFTCKKDEMLMVGDASGKDGQFSDSDKKTAINFKIDYLDVSDFVEKYKLILTNDN